MMPAILILVLAWTLKGMTDALGIGTFVRSAINLNSSLMNFVPLVIFCIAIFIAFSSGTSWGTFAIFVPIVVNMFAELEPTMMIISVAAVLAGAVCVTIFRLFLILPSCPAPVPSPTISTMCKPRCSTPLWSLPCVLLAT